MIVQESGEYDTFESKVVLVYNTIEEAVIFLVCEQGKKEQIKKRGWFSNYYNTYRILHGDLSTNQVSEVDLTPDLIECAKESPEFKELVRN